MRDLPWKPYLEGKEVQHREDVLRAYHLELNSLLSTVLREVKEGDAEWDAAQANHTTCRALLEWKRQGLWKCRVVIQGHKENKLALDGPDFEYASDVVGLTAIRALFLKPLQKGFVIGGADGLTAELKALAHWKLSLSPMTFPHELARLLLIEQLFRAQAIQQGSPYHRA